ncbi:MAG: HPr family phosphocarrier protein [bacterium]
MTEKTVKIISSIEARDVAMVVQTASQFKSNIKIKLDNKIINAKSIMGLIALGDLDGKNIIIEAEGADESDAVNELASCLGI